MSQKSLLVLLLAPLFLFSCNKSDDPASEFVINGIHDVSFTSAGSNILALTVQQSSGTQQPVTITVTGLPAGVSADVQPSSGTPAFGLTVTFNQTNTPAPGTYAIHIVGTSSSYTKTYDLNLTVPALNGFIFDGARFNRSSLAHSSQVLVGYTISQILVSSTDNAGSYMGGYASASISEAWPTADGTYTYHVGGMASNAMQVSFDSQTSGGSYISYDNSNTSDTTKQATLIISGGKYKLLMSDIVLQNASGSDTKQLTVNASE